MSSGYHRMGGNVESRRPHTRELLAAMDAVGRGEHVAVRLEPVLAAPDVTYDPTEVHSPISPRDMGYTGNTCSNCGGGHMLVSGHCEVCSDCGTTTGCS